MEERFALFGYILPKEAKFTTQGEVIITTDWEHGEKYHILLEARQGEVSLIVKILNRTGNEWDVRNIVKTQVQRKLDAVGFNVNKIDGEKVLGLDLEITAVTNLTTNSVYPMMDREHLFKTGDAPNLPENFEVLAIENKELARALANFRQAIRHPDETAFFCYRAFESLAAAFCITKDQKVDGAAWKLFRDALHLKQETMTKHDAYKIMRHGRIIQQT